MKIFIPIKQNSQRVPKKNFRIFRELPLYKHTLYKFRNHEIFVNTDSDEIINQIINDDNLSHVKYIRREKHLIGDTVSVCNLIEDFISKQNISEPFAQIHVTTPNLSEKTLVDAYEKIKDYDSVISCEVYQNRFWAKEKYGFYPIFHNPLKLEQTQDLTELYKENSAFYIMRPEVFIKIKSRIGINPYFYNVDSTESMDIDTEADWLKLKNTCAFKV
jgi:CMP-N-acetylneuraminic acid synthetase